MLRTWMGIQVFWLTALVFYLLYLLVSLTAIVFLYSLTARLYEWQW